METTIIISSILRLRQPIRIFLLEKNHRYKIPNAIINPERKFMNTSSSNQFPRSSFELPRIESFSSLEEITLLLLLLLLLEERTSLLLFCRKSRFILDSATRPKSKEEERKRREDNILGEVRSSNTSASKRGLPDILEDASP